MTREDWRVDPAVEARHVREITEQLASYDPAHLGELAELVGTLLDRGELSGLAAFRLLVAIRGRRVSQ